MTIPVLTKTELAKFANQGETYFTSYSETALSQASLLFRLATCLTDMPEDPNMLELAKNAILDMALYIYETDEHRSMNYSPFSSETIGTYSYNISLTKIQSGETLGISWFDMATQALGVCDLMGGSGAHSTGGIEVFEHDGSFIPGNIPGNSRILSPNDLNEYPDLKFWR